MRINTTIVLTATAMIAASAFAGDEEQYFLSDQNSAATFDIAEGQISWEVDGISQLFAQQFYFRRASDQSELLVSTENLTLDGIFASDTNPFRDDSNDALAQLYSDGNGLQIETIFTLRGGTDGSGRSDLAEQIVIRNLSNSSMTLSFFQFVDFDLGGDFADDSGIIINGNTVRQSDDGFSISETVVTPQPTLFQVDDQAVLSGMLNDGAIDDLNGQSSYNGDVAWAFQWNINLDAGEEFIISKDKSIVPTPGSLALMGIAGLLTTTRRRRS